MRVFMKVVARAVEAQVMQALRQVLAEEKPAMVVPSQVLAEEKPVMVVPLQVLAEERREQQVQRSLTANLRQIVRMATTVRSHSATTAPVPTKLSQDVA